MRGEDPTAYYLQVFHAPRRRATRTSSPLVVLDSVLGGAKGMGLLGGSANNRSNRLYRALVETQLAVDVGCSFGPTIDPGLFSFQATLAPDVEHRRGRRRHLGRKLNASRPRASRRRNCSKAIKQTRAQFVYSSESVTNHAYWLGFSAVVTDLDWLDSWAETAGGGDLEDVQRVAATYFVP